MATLQDRIEAARRAAEQAEAKLSPKDVEEEMVRAERTQYEKRAADALRRHLELDLARRADVARDALGEDAKLRSLIVDDLKSPHTFIIKDAGAAAFKAWQQGISDATIGKLAKGTRDKVDRDAVSLDYAVRAVHDWNGITDFSPTTTHGHELIEWLKAHPAVVANIVAAAHVLAGYSAEERKS